MEVSGGDMAKSGGGEVRRVHIIYFLSRMGHIEHPHLIRVHHLNRNGVFLRDVKRWLSDLRGKDMPESFAWSYKRRYKNGYVWQDLLDDDLITPIADNEYVLKGSEIFSIANPFVLGSLEKKAAMSVNDEQGDEAEAEAEEDENRPEEQPSPNGGNHQSKGTPGKTSSEFSQEYSPMFSSEISTVTDDSMKQEDNSHGKKTEQVENVSSSTFYSNLCGKMKNKKKKNNDETDSGGSIEKSETTRSSFSSSLSSSPPPPPPPRPQSPFSESKSYTSGTSKMLSLRNLISCGAVDTNEAVLVPLKQKSASINKPNNRLVLVKEAEFCKGEILGGSARVFGNRRNHQTKHQQNSRKSFDGVKGSKKQQSGFGSSNLVSPAYKPVGAPICSQCGKPFKPENLHAHMKSCRRLKAVTKSDSTSVKNTPSTISVDSPSEDGYFLPG